MSFNVAIIDGRLGKDPEVRATANGKKVVNFSLGSDVGYGDSKQTLWDTVVAWGQQAEFVEKFCKKGSGVLVVGERRSRSWEDKQSGQTKYITEVHADKISFTSSKSSPENGQTESRSTGRTAATPPARTQAAPATRTAVSDDPFGDGTGVTGDDIPW